MSVNKETVKRSLVLVQNDGLDAKGMTKTKNVSFPDVKVDAQPEQIMATASAFATLYKRELVNVYVHDQDMLTKEA
jgi:hypothetical protein